MQKMKVAELRAEASQGAIFEIEGEFNLLTFDINSGCVVSLKGISKNLNADCSAGCVFNAGELLVEAGKFSASAGGIMNLNVTGEISVNANSGSIITCSGKPKTKNINVNSGAQFIN
jgi:phage gp45-like